MAPSFFGLNLIFELFSQADKLIARVRQTPRVSKTIPEETYGMSTILPPGRVLFVCRRLFDNQNVPAMYNRWTIRENKRKLSAELKAGSTPGSGRVSMDDTQRDSQTVPPIENT